MSISSRPPLIRSAVAVVAILGQSHDVFRWACLVRNLEVGTENSWKQKRRKRIFAWKNLRPTTLKKICCLFKEGKKKKKKLKIQACKNSTPAHALQQLYGIGRRRPQDGAELDPWAGQTGAVGDRLLSLRLRAERRTFWRALFFFQLSFVGLRLCRGVSGRLGLPWFPVGLVIHPTFHSFLCTGRSATSTPEQPRMALAM